MSKLQSYLKYKLNGRSLDSFYVESTDTKWWGQRFSDPIDFQEDFAHLSSITAVNYKSIQPDDTVLKTSRFTVFGRDLATTREHTWLNDTVIVGFLSLLLKKQNDSSNTLLIDLSKEEQKEDNSSFHVMDPLFGQCVFTNEKRAFDYGVCRYWGYETNIYSHNIIFMPINTETTHWALIVINFKQKSIVLLDSMSVDAFDAKQLLFDVFKWLYEDFILKIGNLLPGISDWKLVKFKSVNSQQKDGSNCGVFMLMYLVYLTNNYNISAISQKLSKAFRQYIANCIVANKLLTISDAFDAKQTDSGGNKQHPLPTSSLSCTMKEELLLQQESNIIRLMNEYVANNKQLKIKLLLDSTAEEYLARKKIINQFYSLLLEQNIDNCVELPFKLCPVLTDEFSEHWGNVFEAVFQLTRINDYLHGSCLKSSLLFQSAEELYIAVMDRLSINQYDAYSVVNRDNFNVESAVAPCGVNPVDVFNALAYLTQCDILTLQLPTRSKSRDNSILHHYHRSIGLDSPPSLLSHRHSIYLVNSEKTPFACMALMGLSCSGERAGLIVDKAEAKEVNCRESETQESLSLKPSSHSSLIDSFAPKKARY